MLSDLQKLINQVVLIDYTIIILGGGRSSGHFTVLHIKTGEKDHEAAEKGDGVDLKISAAYDTLIL